MNANDWTFSRLDKTRVEAVNEAGNIRLVFTKNPDGSWDGRCQNTDEILASYRRLGMKPDAKALAGIMQDAGQALQDFLRKEAEHGS